MATASATVITAHVINGAIVPDVPVELPEGAALVIHRVPAGPAASPTALDHYRPVLGTLKGLPADVLEQMDHYVYGTPKT